MFFFQAVHGGCGSDEGLLIVYTLEPITPALRTSMTERISDLVIDIVIAPSFPIPSTAKWTKTGPANDRVILGNQNNL